MKRFRKTVSLILAFALTCVFLSACGNSNEKDPSKYITIGIPQDLDDTLDPHMIISAGTKEILFNVFEGLVKPDANGNLIPAVSASYEVSEDGKSLSFVLRDNVKFHDGSTVTVDDVLYCIEKNKGTSEGDALIPAFSNIDKFYAEGNEIFIELKEPDTSFLQYMTMAIIPASNKSADTTAIGTGPYMYVSRSPQENVILKRFDDYWGEKAYIENVTLKICANADTIVMDLLGGSVDVFARITTAQQLQLQGSDFEVLEGTMNLVQALYLNNAVEPFNDINVRKALCYAIDPQEIIDISFDGKGTVIGSSMYPAFKKYYVDELKNTYTKDLDKAKQLLSDAGYPNGFSFEIKVPSNYQPHIDTAQVIVEQLKQIGVNAEIKLIEWDTWVSDVYTGRNFQSTVIGVDASNMTARAMLERFVSDYANNFVNFNNAQYDELMAKAINTADDEEATKLYKECEKILADDAANVYIQDMAQLVAINKKYTGYEFYPIYVCDIAKIKPVE